MRILFQGDSITDWQRKYEEFYDLGLGYVRFAAEGLREQLPGRELEFINRGMSGDRTRELKKRWQTECIDLQPDFVSILIGLNDTWRAFDQNDPTPAQEYEDSLRAMLEDVKQHTRAKILLLEPFLLHDTPDKDEWRADLDAKIERCRKLAREYADAYLPLDGILAAASVQKEPAYWAADGIHPTEAGAKLIARYYVEAALPLLREL